MANTKKAPKAAAPFHVRQGDVLVIRVDAIPAGVRKRRRAGGRVILAEGEVTGHHHAIADTIDAPAAAIYDDPTDASGFYLRVESPTGLVHEEHARIELPVGEYRVIRQREYSPEAIRNVAD